MPPLFRLLFATMKPALEFSRPRLTEFKETLI